MKVIEKSNRLLFDDYFRIREGIIQFEKHNGLLSKPLRRLSFERGDAAAVLIKETDTNSFIFVNQFRYPVFRAGDGWTTEIVAGMVEDCESPDECIRREAREETGACLTNVKSLGSFFTSPGGSAEQVRLFMAEVEPGAELPDFSDSDGTEKIMIIRMDIEQARGKLADGFFNDAKTIIALQNYFLYHA